jgi:hypothetical protein
MSLHLLASGCSRSVAHVHFTLQSPRVPCLIVLVEFIAHGICWRWRHSLQARVTKKARPHVKAWSGQVAQTAWVKHVLGVYVVFNNLFPGPCLSACGVCEAWRGCGCWCVPLSHVCVYACVYVYVYVCMPKCMCTHVCLVFPCRMYVCMYVCTHVCVLCSTVWKKKTKHRSNTSGHSKHVSCIICMYICINVCTYVCTYVCNIYIYIYIYTHTHKENNRKDGLHCRLWFVRRAKLMYHIIFIHIHTYTKNTYTHTQIYTSIFMVCTYTVPYIHVHIPKTNTCTLISEAHRHTCRSRSGCVHHGSSCSRLPWERQIMLAKGMEACLESAE